MPLKLKKNVDRLVDLAVEVGDETIKLKYRSNLITPNFLAGPESEAEFCAAVIAEWDVTLDEQPYPPTPANLNEMEASLVYQLCYSIINHTKAVAASKSRAAQLG